VVWRDGSCSARHVQEALAKTRVLAMTSVITVMNIMVEKKYLQRVRGRGSYLYRASKTKESTAGNMVKDLVQRLFGGSTAAMVLNLLKTSDVDREELEELREILERKERDREKENPS